MPDPDMIPPLWGASHGDPDPKTGLPTIEVSPGLAAILAAVGWRRVATNIENEYVEGRWVLDHIDPDGHAIGSLGYSIEPSGHHTSPSAGVVIHRGDDCTSPAVIIRPAGPGGLPPTVVVAAAAGLKRDDVTEIGRPCPAGGLVTVLDRVIREGDDLLGTYDAVCSVCGTVGTSMIRHHVEAAAAAHRRLIIDLENSPERVELTAAHAGQPCAGAAAGIGEDDQETWDPDGSGDTHYGVEVDGYPLPPTEE